MPLLSIEVLAVLGVVSGGLGLVFSYFIYLGARRERKKIQELYKKLEKTLENQP